MKKTLLIIFFFFMQKINAQSIFMCNKGEVTFFSKAPIENIDAVSNSMNSVLNTATGEIVFIVPMTSFKFKKALMQEHFNEKYMESDKYPNGTFKGKIDDAIDFTKDGEYSITATGMFTIHGVEQKRTEKGKIVIKDGSIQIQSEFMVALKDHKIRVPKLLMQNIAEVVQVNFNADYSPFKKEN